MNKAKFWFVVNMLTVLLCTAMIARCVLYAQWGLMFFFVSFGFIAASYASRYYWRYKIWKSFADFNKQNPIPK